MPSELNAEESAASLLDRVNVVENAEEYQRYLVESFFFNHCSSNMYLPNLFHVIHIFLLLQHSRWTNLHWSGDTTV